ncbi:hypothetical protein BDE36_3336 [Arcticibacter tournemirensis]|uniref:Uncharacterized protein n=1 Tax=Arcticibacter tournemirensis TaxID=699437 RepID=A0A5M9GZA5_9SPHI|nr:hypothetical protein [Arcticibacter tournemirensis]KAA8479976.1 hypothetical protein F1649_16235 [Arcticibacter tournemirensis]TQM51557.1 hypothetical protein BDE36_3336 [Arcticibacter tournemirensis]
MKLPIENWLDHNKFPSEVTHLLKDSIICYKAGAFTSSLLMSYLGFLALIKGRIMMGNKPSLLPDYKWNNLLKELINEDKWEAAVFDALQKQEVIGPPPDKARTEDPIFAINDSVRLQIRYWKDRRNDCAHNKDNLIINAHVEAFWSFLISNLPKLTIEGGVATLINKLITFYDPNQTPPNASILPILQLIPSAVEKNEMKNFWKKAFEVIDNTEDWYFKRSNNFIKSVLSIQNELMSSSLLAFLKANEDYLLPYVDEHPEIITTLELSPEETRQFWRKKVLPRNNFLKIYSSMLRNNLIPKEEIDEANKLFASKMKYTNDYTDHLVLRDSGFGTVLYSKLFVEANTEHFKFWEYLNDHYIVYRQYIEFYPLDLEIVKLLSKEFSKSWHSYFLKDQLNELFTTSKSKREEFTSIATSNSITLPTELTSLSSS